ncbi:MULTISPECIES: linear amide C-N hydrolase [Paracoccus]|jgi:choloylglycine hydrolase|uniref:Penicillin amidase, Cysteine peptidase, MEROPS family C59 n=1 Tax=Paracoccus denitrificans (strain Pd 1222) TaxID=318586 RepID=A1B0H8_PARDP|nr:MULTISPECIES: linear amide C-N hydrolase [Paracoccus]ABL69022.1 penicillin amidase, Cysteine peptidase, MEROPS family C59 [Paracoccus denitrificans PD1222]MBB4625253.1 choloylglycine hydrolase [Paracoccus denitrificans]MCU7428079.1 linear amide C-N hydrolase [Paracoccus denitrificans]MDK8873565.1 linear amide C-N hydrolase [Paracoccus sp. SSJ]QAR27057.1 linear amide C-N hydrolase [Paracoccus denitrificans]
MFRKLAAAFALTATLTAPVAEACTRVTYLGPEGRVLTGRSMDWSMPMVSNLWLFPKGMKRDGAAGPRSVEWVSKYGSVVVSGYDISTVDGMNEEGLVANMLWLLQSRYPEDDGQTPRMSLAVWAQFFLDNFATVDEAVQYLRAHPFDTVTKDVPAQPGKLTTVHLSLSDATGDSAILEWIDGELQIHHGRQYRVMTNDPPYDQQLAITDYWKGMNPRETLPGTTRAADRFVRASTYVDMVAQSDDPRIAASAVFSVVRNASVPYGVSIPDAPNLSTTRWRVVADQKSRLYYVESAISPNTFWVDLKELDFSEGAPVRKLDLGVDMATIHAGESSDAFADAEPFPFEPAD